MYRCIMTLWVPCSSLRCDDRCAVYHFLIFGTFSGQVWAYARIRAFLHVMERADTFVCCPTTIVQFYFQTVRIVSLHVI